MHSEIYESPNRVQVNRRICNMPLRYRGEDCDIEMIWLVIHASHGPEESSAKPRPVLHHHSFFETHMVLQGSQAYQLENGKELAAEEGEVLVLPPETIHRGLWESDDMAKVAFAFSIEKNDAQARSPLLDCFLKEPAVYAISDTLPMLIRLLMQEIMAQQKFCRPFLDSVLYQLVLSYARLSPASPRENRALEEERAVDSRVGEITRYIEAHIGESIQVSDIAAHIHISPKQINRILQRELQINCGAYVDRKKAEQAKQLLAYTDMQIPDIAAALGFANSFSFSKFFRRVEGLPPGLFRQSRYNHLG